MANKNRNARNARKVVEPISIKEEKGNVIMVDTNVLINDPNCISEFIKGGNAVVIPKTVIFELDKLKMKAEIKLEVRTAIKAIYNFRKEKSDKLFITWKQIFSKLELDKTVADHQIIATFNHVLQDKKFAGYKKFKLISDDATLLIIAGEIFADNPKVEIEPYNHIRVKLKKTPKVSKPVVLREEDFDKGACIFKPQRFKGLKENAGILLKFGETPEYMAIRKGNKLIPLDINNSVCGIKPMNEGLKDGKQNWKQAQLIAQLLDPKINVVLISGVAGTGKTLLSLAAALQQRQKYNQIILTRPAVPLEDKDELGFLPGDLNAKMAEYIVPFAQDLEVIIEANAKNQNFYMRKVKNATSDALLTELRRDSFAFLNSFGIKVNAVQHYRGRTYHNTWIIVDEAQNLSPHQVKSIITRAGRNCKIVLTGDLDQIDKRFLNSENSGLAYAMVKMEGSPMVGVTMLTHTVRSEIASYAEKVL